MLARSQRVYTLSQVIKEEKRDEEGVGHSRVQREKERLFLELREKAGVARERLVAKEWEEREKERKRRKESFCCFRRELKKGEDPQGPVGSSFW